MLPKASFADIVSPSLSANLLLTTVKHLMNLCGPLRIHAHTRRSNQPLCNIVYFPNTKLNHLYQYQYQYQ